jgi:hypothetical protein
MEYQIPEKIDKEITTEKKKECCIILKLKV